MTQPDSIDRVGAYASITHCLDTGLLNERLKPIRKLPKPGVTGADDEWIIRLQNGDILAFKISSPRPPQDEGDESVL